MRRRQRAWRRCQASGVWQTKRRSLSLAGPVDWSSIVRIAPSRPVGSSRRPIRPCERRPWSVLRRPLESFWRDVAINTRRLRARAGQLGQRSAWAHKRPAWYTQEVPNEREAEAQTLDSAWLAARRARQLGSSEIACSLVVLALGIRYICFGLPPARRAQAPDEWRQSKGAEAG